MSKYDLKTIQDKNVLIDTSELIGKEVVYINATQIAKQFGKNKQRLNEFFNSKSFKEYENAISKVTKNRDFNNDEKSLKYSIKGKYGGIYLHSDLVIVFLRWLNVDFAIQCDLYIKGKIQEVQNERIAAQATAAANQKNDAWLEARKKSKYTRKNFTDVIKDFCDYAEAQRDEVYPVNRCPYFHKLTSMAYDVLGIVKPKNGNPRDIFSGDVVESIERIELAIMHKLELLMLEAVEYHKIFKLVKKHISKMR